MMDIHVHFFPECCLSPVSVFMRQLAGATAGLQEAARWVQGVVCANPSTAETTAIAAPVATTVTHNAHVRLH